MKKFNFILTLTQFPFLRRSSLYGIVCAVFVTIFLSQFAYAQRPPRADLHSLTATEQQTLASLIDQFLDENPNVVDDHVTNFFTGIHNSSNFLPWHRIHIRMLEDFLSENGGGQFVPLPKWQPEINPGGGLPKIPTPFQVTASGAPISVGGNIFNPNPNPTSGMNTFTNNLANCTSNMTDAGDFSDIEEGTYHNPGHGIVNGRMAFTDSPDCLIFWPWHAWVDEHWYQWEQNCAGEFDINDVNGDNVIDITTPTTWSGEMFVKGKVVVQSGATLTVASGAVIHFLSSDYAPFETSICVMPGGRLTIDGGTLTGMDLFGNGGQDGEGGVKYYSGWNGVTVIGTGTSSISAHGRVWIKNGGTIEHAKIGINAKSGGRIIAQSSNFINNRVSVKMNPYAFNNFSMFTNCDFINDEALRDVVWKSSPIAGNIIEHHIDHDLPHSTEAHMYLDNVTVFSISGCTFDSPFQDPHIYAGGRRGIKAINSKFPVSSNCVFSNLKMGIDAKNTIPGPGRNVTVSNSQFGKNVVGIQLIGVDYSSVRTCSFDVPSEAPFGSDTDAFGFGSEGSAALTLKDNTFSTAGGDISTANYGMIIDNSGGNFASIAQRNSFNGINIGTQMEQTNTMLQVKCHDFNQYEFGMAVTSGTLANQGNCFSSMGPAGSTWDDLNFCFGSDRQIFRDASASAFVYNTHSNIIPTCVSFGVFVFDCGIISQGEQSCAEPIDPCSCPPFFCCAVDELAELESAKQSLISTVGSEEAIWGLNFKQKRKFHESINGLFEAEEEGQATPALELALEFIDEVSHITQTYEADKAALLLMKSEQGIIDPLTATAISSLPANDDNKTLLNLKLDLLTTNRTYSQMTALEEQTIRALASQSTKGGAHAKAILEEAFGEAANFDIERIEGVRERSGKQIVVDNVNMKDVLLECYPNPASDELSVRVYLQDEQGQATISIVDMTGRPIKILNVNEEGNEELTRSFDTSEFAPGIYFVRFEIGGEFIAGNKIVIKR